MNDPIKEIPGVIHLLTQSPPSLQREAIDKYFTTDAAFSHPLCRTWSFPNSRLLVQATYRWYKIMSPQIDLTVQSVAFDESNLKLYVTIYQIFRIWLVPFYYAPVNFTTVLTLSHQQSPLTPSPHSSSSNNSLTSSRRPKYYIKKQDDLYQVDQWIRFILPGGWVLIWAWWAWSTFFCLLGCFLLRPVTWIEENWGWGEGVGRESHSSLRLGDKRAEVRQDGLTGSEMLARTELRGKVFG